MTVRGSYFGDMRHTGARIHGWWFSCLIMLICVVESNYLMAEGCKGPAEKIRVTVEQVQFGPPKYAFVVSNNSNRAVRVFSIGRGDKNEMQSHRGNTPTEVTAPEGWRGQAITGHESSYMHVWWEPRGADGRIAPGKALDGFSVTMVNERNRPRNCSRQMEAHTACLT